MARSLALIFAALTASCTLLGPPSRVREGQLYRAGDAKYDVYFAEVNDLQRASAKWGEETAAARKPLLDELKLPADASEATIVGTAHEKLDASGARLEVSGEDAKIVGASGALAQALESTAKAELARAKKLKAVPPRCETLGKQGHELEARVDEDFAKLGGQKPYEVKKELAASYDALDGVSGAAARNVKDAEYFVADLQRAIGASAPAPAASSAPPPAVTHAPAPPSSHPAPPPSRPNPPIAAAPRPPAPVATQAAPAKSPPPPPPPAGEVFNP